MPRFADWIRDFNGKRSFAASPLTFDGMWIDHYLREFADSCLLDVPHWGQNIIFTAVALDIGTYMSGVLNRTDLHGDIAIPSDWLGDHEHTHRAIGDARGYAAVLARLLRASGTGDAAPGRFPEISGRGLRPGQPAT